MAYEVGSVVKGVVEAIKPFGAFVKLENGEVGLIHISKVSSDYVRRVSDYLSVGDEVEVKILEIKEDGKIALELIGGKLKEGSSRREENSERRQMSERKEASEESSEKRERSSKGSPKERSDFERKFAEFKRISDSTMMDLRRRSDRRSK